LLFIKSPSSLKGTRDSKEDIFFDDLPIDYKVYLLYYSGPIRNKDIEGKLREFGNYAGKNLFVNIAKLNDPNYRTVVQQFKIKDLPSIIMTAIDTFAAIEYNNYFSTVYVRLDNKQLLKDTDRTVDAIGKLFNIFISGKVLEALEQARLEERNANFSDLINKLIKGLNAIGKFLKDFDVSISLLEGKFEIKGKGVQPGTG
jgi:hypothetical protein